MDFDYFKEYEMFMSAYKRGVVSGEEVGEVIMKMAHFHAKYAVELVFKDRRKNLVARDIEITPDANGKAISSAKALTLTEATDEYHDYNMAKAHVANIEQYINALKALQKGVLQEYSNSNL